MEDSSTQAELEPEPQEAAQLEELQPAMEHPPRLSTPSPLQSAALATKEHPDLLDPRERLDLTERMETMERTDSTEKMRLSSPRRRQSLASSVQLDIQDLKELWDQRAHPDPRDPQESHQRTEFPASQEPKDSPDPKESQDARDLVELQDSRDVSSPCPVPKAQLVPKDLRATPDQKDSPAQTDNPSRDLPACQEMPESQDPTEEPAPMAQLDQPAPTERRDLAITARSHVLPQATSQPTVLLQLAELLLTRRPKPPNESVIEFSLYHQHYQINSPSTLLAPQLYVLFFFS